MENKTMEGRHTSHALRKLKFMLNEEGDYVFKKIEVLKRMHVNVQRE